MIKPELDDSWCGHGGEIEAICRDCGQQMAEGCVPHRSLDAYRDEPGDPYCPNCEGDNLKFLPSREDFPRDRDC